MIRHIQSSSSIDIPFQFTSIFEGDGVVLSRYHMNFEVQFGQVVDKGMCRGCCDME